MLATLIAKVGLPALITLITGALGSIDNPVAKTAAKSLENFEGALVGGAITPEQIAEANRHAEEMAKLQSKEYETALSEVNQTIRVEASSSDSYVRRMRPTFGYLLAITWAAQMLALAYIVIFETDQVPAVFDSMEALSTMWAVALSVLGVYVYKRSEEKKAVTLQSKPASQTQAKPVEKRLNITAAVTKEPKYNE